MSRPKSKNVANRRVAGFLAPWVVLILGIESRDAFSKSAALLFAALSGLIYLARPDRKIKAICLLATLAAAIFLVFAAIFLRSGRSRHVYRVSKRHADGTLTLRPVPKHADDSSEEPNVTLTLSHSPLCLGERFTVKLGGDAASVIGNRPARRLLRCHERIEVSAPVSQRTWKYDNIFYEDAQ